MVSRTNHRRDSLKNISSFEQIWNAKWAIWVSNLSLRSRLESKNGSGGGFNKSRNQPESGVVFRYGRGIEDDEEYDETSRILMDSSQVATPMSSNRSAGPSRAEHNLQSIRPRDGANPRGPSAGSDSDSDATPLMGSAITKRISGSNFNILLYVLWSVKLNRTFKYSNSPGVRISTLNLMILIIDYFILLYC